MTSLVSALAMMPERGSGGATGLALMVSHLFPRQERRTRYRTHFVPIHYACRCSQGGKQVAITIPPALQEILDADDASDSPLDESELASRLNAAIPDFRALPLDQRRGALTLVGGLQFQRRRLHSTPTWDMYWQPLSSFTTEDGREHPSPDVGLIDEEIRADWTTRSDVLRHPVLRARFADLAWTITR
jgi:hypothetical protein